MNKIKYFIRTEETIEDVYKSLKRGRSVENWNALGKNPWYHLYLSDFETVRSVFLKLFNEEIIFSQPTPEDIRKAYNIILNIFGIKPIYSKDEYIRRININHIYRLTHPVYKKINNFAIQESKLFEKELVELLKLESCENGYARYLSGLCSLESFDSLPSFEDCTKKLIGSSGKEYLFKYLVCYKGEKVGEDCNDDWRGTWDLFKPHQIVWIEESGFNDERYIKRPC